MSPWTVLGWLIVGLVAVPFAVWGIRLLWALLVSLPVALFKDVRDQWRLRRAHKGKARCAEEGCRNIATRRTPRGFYCEEHLHNGSRYRSVSYAFPLDHANPRKQAP